MDSNLSGDSEVKAEFRKLSNDVANRKYRRHSPATGSSSSDGSHEQSFSPISPRNDVRKISEHERRKDDNKELDRDSGRTRYKSGDSHRHSDQHVSRNSRGYSRHDDSSRREKHADIEKRHYQTSSHSGREPRVATHFERTREESDHSRARDFTRNADKYSRDRYDSSGHRSKDKDKDLSPDTAGSDRKNFNSASGENSDWRRRDRDSRDGKRDYRKNYSDHRSDRARYHEESRGYRTDFSGREDDGHHVRDSYKNDVKNLDGQREKKKNEKESSKDKDCQSRASWEQKEDTSDENHDSMSKKPKLFTSDRDSDYRRDDERKQSSSSKQAVTITNNLEVDNDLNAAKVAALKAAELVNRNLVGTGFMSTEQKKKLLWGSKKSTTSEESGRRWDSALFDDRERQEKFNKLMGVKGDVNVEHKIDNQDAEKQKELQMDLEKQYTAGLRRRDGRTVGLGL